MKALMAIAVYTNDTRDVQPGSNLFSTMVKAMAALTIMWCRPPVSCRRANRDQEHVLLAIGSMAGELAEMADQAGC